MIIIPRQVPSGAVLRFMINTIDQYLNWKASYAVAAARNYRLWLVRLKEYVKKDLELVTLDEYVRHKLLLDGRYASKTVQLATIAIRDFYKYLYEREIKTALNYRLIKISKAKARSYLSVTEEEYNQLLRWCCVTNYRELQKTLILRLLWDTGMRVSELCSLNLTSMHVPKKYGTVVTKKNNQQRMIFWSDDTHEVLIKYLGIRICLNQQPALFQGILKGEGISLRMTTRTAQRVIAELALRAGIKKKISPHSFRHSKAHMILQRGGTVADISRILGHLAPVSSFTYLQLMDMELEKRARMFL